MSAEQVADWCIHDGQVSMCGTRMVEHSRRPMGERWCFRHRTRHEFFWVVMAPDGLSYYGPHVEIHGPTNECTDLFPGRTREWMEG